MKTYQYKLFGLSIESEMVLSDLEPLFFSNTPDVVIKNGYVPEPDNLEADGLYISSFGAVLNITDVGRYLISDGDMILVEPHTKATNRNIRLYLLGSAFGAILHQRGLLPLHANIINFGDAAVAFMGHSGAGKSTLAAWFHDRGLPILGDDVCVVKHDSEDKPIAEPGLRRVRLWGDALEASGRMASDYETSFDDMDKYDVPTSSQGSHQPLRLAAIYNLHAIDAGCSSYIKSLAGVDALHALIANTYRGAFIPMLGGVERHISQCVALARQIPIFELHRRWGLSVMSEEGAYIESHVRKILNN